MPLLAAILAQAGSGATTAPTRARSEGDIFVWAAVLIVVLFVGFGALAFYRKWMRSTDSTTGGGGFSLSDLRRLHREGKMTDEEFEKARAIIVGPMKAAMDQMPKPTDRAVDPVDEEVRKLRERRARMQGRNPPGRAGSGGTGPLAPPPPPAGAEPGPDASGNPQQ